jgi:hypothetical protein
MPYLAREDGEHFVIPAYRDVISVKGGGAAKKEILALSESYGQYITLQSKGPLQYEVACSPDAGYLLGESIWNYFKRPLDMIYCEAVPNTTEAILVIVKGGSVYLDGRFPTDSIQEELVTLLTQDNHFAIYVSGDVPISEHPESGKFSFDAKSVRSFTVLEAPVFPSLPLYKAYQLQLVNQILKERGIGGLPLKPIMTGVITMTLCAVIWIYFSTRETVQVTVIKKVNPYQDYNNLLTSPAPDDLMQAIVQQLSVIFAMPGWVPQRLDYANGALLVTVQTSGSNIQTLLDWSKRNQVTLDLNPHGVVLTMPLGASSRPAPTKIYPLKQVVIDLIDNLSMIYPGNNFSFTGFTHQGVYSVSTLTIHVAKFSPIGIGLIGKVCHGLPLVLTGMALDVDDSGLLTGNISLEALGN